MVCHQYQTHLRTAHIILLNDNREILIRLINWIRYKKIQYNLTGYGHYPLLKPPSVIEQSSLVENESVR